MNTLFNNKIKMPTVRSELIRRYQASANILLELSDALGAVLLTLSDDVPEDSLAPLEDPMDALQVRLDELNRTFNAECTDAELEARIKTLTELARDIEVVVRRVRDVRGH